MASQTSRGFYVWDLSTDLYDHTQLAANWVLLDSLLSQAGSSIRLVAAFPASPAQGDIAITSTAVGGFSANTLIRYDGSAWRAVGPFEIFSAIPTSDNYIGRLGVLTAASGVFSAFDVIVNTDGSNTWQIINKTTSTPAGTIQLFAGSTPPSGYLLCDGTAYSRTTYSGLFAQISTNYGAGDGVTTFNVPDFQGRIPVGKGANTDAATLGNSEGLTNALRSPKHQHTIYDPGHTHSTTVPVLTGAAGSTNGVQNQLQSGSQSFSTDSKTTGIKVNPQGASSSTNPVDAPAYLVVNYIIKT